MQITKKTIGQMLEEVSEEYPHGDALIHTELGIRYTYQLLSWDVDRVARGLLNAGVGKGDKIALWAPNIPEWIVSLLALARIGALIIPIEPGADREDLEFMLGQSECKGMIMVRGMDGEEFIDTALYLKDRVSALEQLFVISEKAYPDMMSWADLTDLGEEVDAAALTQVEGTVRPEDPVAIMYTSGTTGKPKGVVLDHQGLISKSVCSTERQGLTQQDRLCLFFPLFHMFGNTCIALAGLLKGSALVMPSKTFDVPQTLRAIDKEKCTAVYGSPSMLIALLDHPEFRKKRWRGVKKGTIGGAPCPMELMRRLVEEVGISHITVGYGITEASSWVAMTHPGDPIELRVSTIGTPLPCNELKIVDPHTGESLPPHKPGELCIRGFLMKEYYKMPAATAAVIDREGWFHTGDLGVRDEKDYFKITGRLKDTISREGVEIYPVEVEEIIYGLPQVSEAQVFGFPHPEKGQEVAAWVRLKQGSSLSAVALAAHVKDHVDEEKLPHYFKIVEEFPMTRSGKVQKFKLAEMAEKEYV